jgi:uncharacterized protein HemY
MVVLLVEDNIIVIVAVLVVVLVLLLVLLAVLRRLVDYCSSSTCSRRHVTFLATISTWRTRRAQPLTANGGGVS